MAAAHAGYFTMKLSYLLDEAGFTAYALQTTAYVNFEMASIKESHLVLKADVPGSSKETFEASIR